MLILGYLRILAKLQLAKIKPQHIIGITGSAGKSTCREMVYAVLSIKYKCKQSATGNSESGIPLDILELKMENYSAFDWLRVCLLAPWQLLTNWQKYEIYIVEMAVDSPKEPKNMSYLLKIVKPDIAIILNILPVHTEFFDTLENIANEKFKLIASLPSNGWGLVNKDDPLLVELTQKSKQKNIHFFGRSEKIDLKNYLWHEGLAYVISAALKVGELLEININEAKKALQKVNLPKGRISIIPGIRKTILIDSSYNSSPGPLAFMLRAVYEQYSTNRRIAVLGDMRELGEKAMAEHKKAGELALKTMDYIFTVGALTEKYFPNDPHIQKFTHAKDVIPVLKDFIKKGDVILFKGSQNTIFLEQIVEALMLNQNDADKLLCRRGKFWDKKRE